MEPKTLAIASDHGGYELKQHLIKHLTGIPNLELKDLGVHSTDSVDYPDIATKMVDSILSKASDIGILICGTGIGISIKANRYKGIRAALVHDAFTAEMSKAHNNANILCLGGRTADSDQARRWVDIWLQTPFEGGRHENRIKKIDQDNG